jgi:hypothetical protein
MMLAGCMILGSGCKEDSTGPVATTGTIMGHVTNGTGDTVIASALITTDPATSSVSTDASGWFQIHDVTPGEILIRANKSGYFPRSVRITVVAGRNATADIHLNRTGSRNPPDLPVLIAPSYGSLDQLTSLTLQWSCTDPDGDALTYDVYVGTSNPPTQRVSTRQQETVLSRIGLDTSTTYYWRVVAIDSRLDTTPGEVWNFRTSSVYPRTLLYLKQGNVASWTAGGEYLTQYTEIQRLQEAGYVVEARSLDSTTVTPGLLLGYIALRLNGSWSGAPHGSMTSQEGEAIGAWVRAGGKLFADIVFNGDVPAVSSFGVARIDGAAGGIPGTEWHFHGAPMLIGPVSGPDDSVTSMAAEVMDYPILVQDHPLTIAASIGGYPAVVYGTFGTGKVVIVFAGDWSHDATLPTNGYRANIFEAENLLFLHNVIQYLRH